MAKKPKIVNNKLPQFNLDLAAAHQALEQERQRYQNLFEFIPDGCLLTDTTGIIQTANPAMTKLLVTDQKDLIGKPLVNFVAEEDHQIFYAQLTRLTEVPQIQDWEVRLVPQNGNPLFASIFVTVENDSQSNVVNLRWLLRDITEQRLIETKINQSDYQLLTLQYAGTALASNPNLQQVLNIIASIAAHTLGVEACAISEWDQTTDTISVMVEYGPDDWWDEGLLTKDFHLADFPSTQRVLMERVTQQLTISQPGVDPYELEYIRAIQIKSLLMLPMIFRNQVIGLVEIMDSRVERTFTDQEIVIAQLLANQAAGAMENARLYDQAQQEITERRQTEGRLRQSEVRNRALLDAIPDIICRLTPDGEFLDFRGGQSEDLVVPSEKHIGKNVREVLNAEAAKLFLDHIHKTLASGTTQVFEYHLETSKGFQEYETRLANSGPNEVLGIIRNIAERKRAEKQALHNERLATLGKLAATLAHEINNPLQAIRSHLDLALNYSSESEKRKKHLRIILRQIERLHNLSQPILDLARPKSIPKRQVHVAELIEQVLDLAHRQLIQNNLEVITDIRDTPSVLAIPAHLIQVFLNLVLNAIDSTSGNGQLSITAYQEDEQVIIAFANNGPAIPPAALPYVFEPFFTTKTEGNGLGLWISRNLIQQQGGTLTVTNLSNDQGVVFLIKLPSFPPESYEHDHQLHASPKRP